MESILAVVNGMAWLAAVLGGSISVIYVVYAGYLFISASGDPQRIAQSRSALIGVVVGLTIIGGGFIIPNTISRYIIEPAGGVRVEALQGTDCDRLLRGQLVFQRAVSNPERMQFLIGQIQGKRSECAPERWSPVVRKKQGHPKGCFDSPAKKTVGGVSVPDGLKTKSLTNVKDLSVRDSDNNIIVFWAHPDGVSEVYTGLPSDGSVCWLFLSAFDAWVEGYPQEFSARFANAKAWLDRDGVG